LKLFSEYRYDRNVRILSQLFLIHIWPILSIDQQTDLLMKIIEKHRCLASKERRPRFCTNSLEHRIMFRSLQCLLCLTSIIKDSVQIKPKLASKFYFFLLNFAEFIKNYL